MLRRVWALTVKEFIHLKNDWWLPAFMLFGGVLELLLIGWATSRPITNLPMMVMDLDHSSASRQLIAKINNTDTFEVDANVRELREVEQALIEGDISAGIVIPAGFGRDLVDPRESARVAAYINGAESIPAKESVSTLTGLIRDWNSEIFIDRFQISEEAEASFAPRLRIWYNQELSEAFYTVPAELGLMLEFTVLLFAALAFSREKELGTLEQLLVMPYSSLEIIIGKAIPVIIIGFVDFGLMLMMTHYAFGVPIRGSLLLLLTIAFGYLMVELGKGMVISVVSKTQHQAFLLVMLVGMGDFMFTGYAAPVEAMPEVVQFLANFIPAQHWLFILRGIMLKGSGLDVLWPSIAALAAIGAVILTFSLRFVRRSLE